MLVASIKEAHYLSKMFCDIDLTNFLTIISFWRRIVVVITIGQLHSTKPELRFCVGSNPARGLSEIRDGEDL